LENNQEAIPLQAERMCEMLQTVRAVIREGKIVPLEGVSFPEGAKVIVTLLPEEDEPRFWLSASETALIDIWENTEDDIYAELLQK
jgi:predicted DNA-binding antitoxin AbrB/MazE fold protein